jgi:hypothetical protein
MVDFTVNRRCTACGVSYGVELRKMRLNLQHPCPACGFPNGISEDQAIEAQRLLETLELERRLPNFA